jgi:hypothetical protein
MNSPEWLAVEEGIAEFLDMDSIQLSDIRETVINQLAHQQNTIN